MKKAELVCGVCGKVFFMKDALRTHDCIEEKQIIKEETEITRKELLKMAKESGVKGADRMSKDALIEAVSDN